jgi:hypothetical protein
MKLYVKFFSLPKFLNLFDDSPYLRTVLRHYDGNVYFIETDNIEKLKNLLRKENINYTFKED